MCPVCEHDEPWLHSERVVGLILVDDDGRLGERHVQAAGLGCETSLSAGPWVIQPSVDGVLLSWVGGAARTSCGGYR